MLNIWTRAFFTCLGFVAFTPVPAQSEVSFPGVMQDLHDGGPAQRPATRSADVGSKSLVVDGKRVNYSVDPSAHVRFFFDSDGYRNTYILDCEKRRFRWVQNVLLTTGEVTGNSAGAEWKPINPSSTISNAVFDAACPQMLTRIGSDDNHPAWIDIINTKGIIPGVGLAGVELGDSEEEIINILGTPDDWGPLKLPDGSIMRYRFNYEYQSVSLTIYTSPQSRSVFSFRLSDSKFNENRLIPEVREGAGIGSVRTELIDAFGQPTRIDQHSTCPDLGVGHHETKTFQYQGVSFWVCDGNGLVYLLDIP